MTNVPNNIRDMWSDVYKLYDINYNMPNTKEAWEKFWQQATAVTDKHTKDCHFVNEMINVVVSMLEEPMKRKLGIINPCTFEDMNLF